MTNSIRHFIRALAVITFTVAAVFTGGPALAAVLTVDDDGAQCATATFTDIQPAVDAAAPGDTIRVCAGTYTKVLIPAGKDGLIVQGFSRRTSPVTCLNFQPPNNTDTVVNGGAGVFEDGFRVLANNTTIKNFTVQNASDNSAGINLSSATSGNRILDNTVQDNTFGLYLNNSGSVTATDSSVTATNSSATPTLVQGNCFRNNNVPGPAAGNGIYSDQGLSNADILNNNFTGHENASIILVGAAHDDVVIRDNDIIQDAPVILTNLTNGVVSRNVITGGTGSAIFSGGGVSDTEIATNRILDCAFSGINLRASFTGVPNTNVLVSRNTVKNCGDFGIAVRDGSNLNTISDNRSENNFHGLFFEDGDNNQVLRNVMIRNDADGLRVDANSTGNTFRQNRPSLNVEHDCHDDSVGGGTGGTDNTYVGNTGTLRTPAGICPP